MLTPTEWAGDMAVHEGATFNLAHSLDQMLCFRPHNRFEDVKGVYLVGGGTHPGSGLPVIFESARISCRLLAQDLNLPSIRIRWPWMASSGRRFGADADLLVGMMARDLPIGIIGGGLGVAWRPPACWRRAWPSRHPVGKRTSGSAARPRCGNRMVFRFDMGADHFDRGRACCTVYSPRAGRSTADLLDLRRLDPQWRCFLRRWFRA